MAIIVTSTLAVNGCEALGLAASLARRMNQQLLLHIVVEGISDAEIRAEREAHALRQRHTRVDVIFVSHASMMTELRRSVERSEAKLVVMDSDLFRGGTAAPFAPGLPADKLEIPVLLTSQSSGLRRAIEDDGFPRVVIALEHSASDGAPVIREARLFRNAIPCNFTLLCASPDTAPLAESLGAMAASDSYDMAILNLRSFAALRPPNRALEKTTLLVSGERRLDRRHDSSLASASADPDPAQASDADRR